MKRTTTNRKGARKLPASFTFKAPPASTDAKMIRDCVRYAQTVAAYHAAHKADPDGDCAYAVEANKRNEGRSAVLLTNIAAHKATTADGISAKARIMPMILHDDDCDGPFPSIEEVSAKFYRSFAADVQSYISEEQSAEHAAEVVAKGGAA